MRGKNIEIKEYPHKRDVDILATRANNMGIYTVESMVGGTQFFFEDDHVVISTKYGYIHMTIERAETIAEELLEIIPMVRQDRREGRKPMDSRSIGKMLERDFA